VGEDETGAKTKTRWVDSGGVGWGGVDGIGLAQDKDKWRALVNEVMNFFEFQMLRNYRVATVLVAT
jgi:hypothetical protein